MTPGKTGLSSHLAGLAPASFWVRHKESPKVRANPRAQTKKEIAMNQNIAESHDTDESGNPSGGTTTGTGISIEWQNGPLNRGVERIPPNGAFVEGVINAAIGRLEHYQNSKFRCRENALAITKLQEAMMWLDWRTRDRESKGVEGTHGTRPDEG